MKKLSRVAALIAISLTSCATFADDFENQADDSGYAVTVEVGNANQKLDISGGFGNEDGNQLSPSIALTYKVNANYSIVGQYTDYGEANLFDSRVTVGDIMYKVDFSSKTTGWSVVGQYMTERQTGSWSLGAKLGLTAWNTRFNMAAKPNDPQYGNQKVKTALLKDNGIAIYGGLIAAYPLSENLDFTANADWFTSSIDNDIAPGENADMLRSRYTMGIKYYF